MRGIRFTKMQGLGNDYLYINSMEEKIGDPAGLAKRMSDRHFGAGSDGLVLIERSDRADFRMRMYNADGTEGRMCGNAARCVGKYIYEKKLSDKKELTLESMSGIRLLKLRTDGDCVRQVTVNMGKPSFRREDIPVLAEAYRPGEPLRLSDPDVMIYPVSMGNPHGVCLTNHPEAVDLERIGPMIEHHPFFPEGVNAEFAQVISPDRIRMRVWERGSGETLACGTGACAAFAVLSCLGCVGSSADVELPGGVLHTEYGEDGSIEQTGPCAFVYEGVWSGGELDVSRQ